MVTDDDLTLLRRYADVACFSASSLNEPYMNARGGQALRRLLDDHAELRRRIEAAGDAVSRALACDADLNFTRLDDWLDGEDIPPEAMLLPFEFPQGDWVRFAEKPPPANRPVLAAAPGGTEPFVARWTGTDWIVESDREVGVLLEHPDDVPTHWMPLPAPPKE